MADWRSESYRDNIVAKLNSHIVAGQQPMRTDARQMEANIFHKARSEHEYMAYIARLIVYIRDKSKTEAKPTQHAADDDDTGDHDGDTTFDKQPAHRYNPLKAPSKSDAVSVLDGPAHKRTEPTASQRLDILRTAIATVLNAPGWRAADAATTVRPQIALFGQYVAAQLARIAAEHGDDGGEELLLVTQQKLLAVLNNAM